MNDRAAGIFENYDVKILGTAKGRGALLAETEQGWLILKEYTGPEARLELQEKLLQAVRDAGFPGVEQLLRNKEGELLTRDDEHWECSFCSWEAETEDFNLPNPETMLYGNRPRPSSGSSKKGGGSFWGDLLSSIGSSIMDGISNAGKK